MFYLPRYTSHFLQPLDDNIFANLKEIWRSLMVVDRFNASLLSVDLSQLLLDSMLEAEKRTMCNTDLIKSAWKNTGIHPFDEEKIKQLAGSNQGRVTTREEREERDALMDGIINETSAALKSIVLEAATAVGLQQRRTPTARRTVLGSEGFISHHMLALWEAQRSAASSRPRHSAPAALGASLASVDLNAQASSSLRGVPCGLIGCKAGTMRNCKTFVCEKCDRAFCRKHLSHKHHRDGAVHDAPISEAARPTNSEKDGKQ